MQRVTDPAMYRRACRLGPDDPVPEVWFGRGVDIEFLERELEEGEPCFLNTTKEYFLQRITLEEYFQRLIRHLRIDAVRHTFDNARMTKFYRLLRVDVIAGSVKSLMLDGSFPRLGEAEAVQLIHLCLLAYRTADPATLSKGAADNGTPLDSLPRRWTDLLATIAYARRHHETLKLLVSFPAPDRKTTFDLFGASVIMGRRSGAGNVRFQHGTVEEGAELDEIRIWPILLESEGGWIHLPLAKKEHGLYTGLLELLAFDENPQMREHPDVERLCRVFSKAGIIPNCFRLSMFLSLKTVEQAYDNPRVIKPVSLSKATMLLECFPIPRVAAAMSKNGRGRKLMGGSSATILMPITQWAKNNKDRLAVMRMLLEQGCDPSDTITNNKWHLEFISEAQRKLGDTPLHQAAERGDDQMVKLLLEFGAKTDIKSAVTQDTPAQRARAYQRFGTAARIEGA